MYDEGKNIYTLALLTVGGCASSWIIINRVNQESGNYDDVSEKIR